MKQIIVPDLGGATEATIIEVHVAPGDTIAIDQPIITLESDKASMDVPASAAGVVKTMAVQNGDTITVGQLVLELEGSETEAPEANAPADAATEEAAAPAAPTTQEYPVVVPDLGGASEVSVIEVLVSVGDTVEKEQSLVTLEGEKATMDVPAPESGEVLGVDIAVGDQIQEGAKILALLVTKTAETPAAPAAAPKAPSAAPAPKPAAPATAPTTSSSLPAFTAAEVYAGPSVRQLARELGVDLRQVRGTGHKQRITLVDVKQYVKQRLTGAPSGGVGLDIADPPKVDFSQFGATEEKPLNKIKKLTAKNLHRNWVMVPHVTQFDEADITDMEGFRQSHKKQALDQGYKLTPLVFIMQAVTAALKEYPQFNASLSPDGSRLILKKYVHLGVAVDTPNGLVVAVVRDTDQKSIVDISKELAALSKKARETGLSVAEMQGACFTISSLGGIGGTAFTPIVNLPDVAILGLSRSQHKPVYQGGEFIPRLMLPLSLSYDHRVIDGAEAARFTQFLATYLADVTHFHLD